MNQDQADLASRSIRPSVLLTAGRATAFAVTFAMSPVLARIFTQAEFGTYKQLILMYTTVLVMAQLGMADSLLYFLPSAPHGGGRYIVHALLVLAGSGLVCLALFVLGGPLLAAWFGNAALLQLSKLLGVSVLLALPATLLEIVLTARKRYASAGLAYGVSDLARAIALIVPAIVTRRLEWLLIGAILFGAIRLSTTLRYCSREFRGELILDPAELRRQVGYALPLQLGVALWILVQNLHYYVVAAGVDAATFAIYAVGCLQVPIFDMVSTPARNLLTVGMREALTANRPRAALQLWHDTTRRLAMVFFPLVGLMFATAHEVIPVLFTDQYAASVPIFMVWLMIGLMLALQADGVLAVYADTPMLARLQAVQLLLIAGLVPVLLRSFGLVGAVQGTVGTIVIGRALVLLRAGRLMRVRLADLLPWRSLGGVLGAAAVAALGATLVKGRLDGPPLLLVLYASAAYTVIYLGILAGQGAGGRGAWLRAAKQIAAAGLVLSGLARLTAWVNRRKPLVLLYHGVHDGALDPVLNLDGLHVRAARFERQMRYIAARYRVVPLDHLLQQRYDAGRKPLAAITFDDGYGNLYANAYPVLKRLGIPATVFVIADFLRGRQVPWWDRLTAMVAASQRPDVGVQVGGTEQRCPLSTMEQKRTALRTLFRKLLALPPDQRETMLYGLAQALGVDGTLATPEPLTVEQLREMADGGMSVGSHGCSHDSFLHLDRERLAVELTESRQVLEAVMGRSVHWLAYPHGEFSRETVTVARTIGYRGGLTAIDEGLNGGIADPFTIRRIAVGEDTDFARFIVATSGLRDALKALLRMVGRDKQRTTRARGAQMPGPALVLSTRAAEEADNAGVR